MKLSTALLALLSTLASATYFTVPQAGTVWDTASGQTITWFYQAGGASTGTILLQSVQANPKANSEIVLAESYDLTTETLDIPDDIAPRISSSDSYRLLIVNSADTSTVYTQVGPFTIESFGEGSDDTTSTRATTTTERETTRSLSRTTNPPVSTSTTRPPRSSSSSSTTTTTSTTTTPSTTSTTSTTSTSSSSSSSSSSETPEPTTVTSTASLVTITSGLSSDTTGPITVISTVMASAASGVVGAPSSTPTSGAAKRAEVNKVGWVGLGTVLAGVAAGMIVLG